MYIQPNSTVKLLKDVPLDASEDHTIYFATATEQLNYFNSYVKTGMTFTKQYYQRHSKNSLKLEVLADNVYDCNSWRGFGRRVSSRYCTYLCDD